MDIETRNLENQLTLTDREIVGHAILFEHESRDLGGFTEIIKPTAVSKELLDQSDIKVYLEHDKQKGILARSKKGVGSLTYEIDEKGVLYRFSAPKTTLGDEVVEGLSRGDYNESSFAMIVGKDSWTKKEDGTYLRSIEQIKGIYDFSIVADGAYSDTYVSIAKRSLDAFIEQEQEELRAKQLEDEKEKDEDEKEDQDEPSEDPDNDSDEEDKEDEDEKRTINSNKKSIMKNFSLLKSINDVVNNRSLSDEAVEVIEAGTAEMRKSGVNYSGQILLPVEERASIVAGTAGAGQEVVAEDKLDILGPLYANSVLAQAGATFMTGLVGDINRD